MTTTTPGGPEVPAVPASHDPQRTLDLLRAGNQRWASGGAKHPGQSPAQRQSLVGGQTPSAVILSCIDSRVPPEIIFDCGLGHLVVVRSAGHALDDVILGSVEFGPCHLATPLVLVLGHQRCGAVTAAVEAFQHDRWPPGHIEDIVEALRPAYKTAAKLAQGDLIESMARTHTMLTVARLKKERAFAGLLGANKLQIVGGWYRLDTGTVEIIG